MERFASVREERCEDERRELPISTDGISDPEAMRG